MEARASSIATELMATVRHRLFQTQDLMELATEPHSLDLAGAQSVVMSLEPAVASVRAVAIHVTIGIVLSDLLMWMRDFEDYDGPQ